MIDYVLQKIFSFHEGTAIIEAGKKYSYSDLKRRVEQYGLLLAEKKLPGGASVALEGQYSFENIALLLALLRNKNIVTIILPHLPQAEKDFFVKTSQVRSWLKNNKELNLVERSATGLHPLLEDLKEKNVPGLVIYTSGTTGEPKGAVHNAGILLSRFLKERKSFITLGSLLFDHIGGLDVLFTTLSSGGTFVVCNDFSPNFICKLIERHQVELFPATATLLRMIAISGEYENYNLSSVKLIAYGSEVMPGHFLKELQIIFPNTQFKQTFGMTEMGTLSTVSRDSDSVYLKFVGSENKVKIVDNKLHIKSNRSMLGYLNAPSPIDEEGWLNTGDEVEVNGEWIKILGRKSDVINVGGQKVYPSEVEEVIAALPFIEDVVIFSEKNVILGNIVVAKISLRKETMPFQEIRKIIKAHCNEKLAAFKVPQKIILDKDLYNYRLKKVRS